MGAKLSLRGLARVLRCSVSLLVMLHSGERTPTPEFMGRAIAIAPEPWKSVLKQARQADQEASDKTAQERVRETAEVA